MIIECENCRTTFNLEENLLDSEGSKVRCSLCRHVFLAYPPEPDEPADEFEETVALDAPFIEEEGPEEVAEEGEVAFDEFLNESLNEDLTGPSPVAEDLEEFSTDEDIDEQEVGAFSEEETAEEETLLEPSEMVNIPPAGKKQGKSRVLLVVLIVILLLAGGGAAVVKWAPQLLPGFLRPLPSPEKTSLVDPGIRRLSFKAVTGSFIKAKKAGRLFVIRGIVTNNYPKNRRFLLIKGTVLDDKGVVVRKKVAYAGNSLSESKLNALSLEEINGAMKNRKNSEVAPEESIPFTIVFEGLPQNLSEFTVEAVSSAPVG